MGGSGSGRYGGRQNSKKLVAAFQEIAIAQLKRDGKIKPLTESVLIRAQGKQQRINITRTACNYGGDRPWFICPKCGNRAGKLYTCDWFLRYQCRKCLDLAYLSNRYSPLDAAIARISRIENKLARTRSGQLTRPKGMHRRTYQALLDELVRAEQAKERAIATEFTSVLGAITRIDFSKIRIDSE